MSTQPSFHAQRANVESAHPPRRRLAAVDAVAEGSRRVPEATLQKISSQRHCAVLLVDYCGTVHGYSAKRICPDATVLHDYTS